MMTRLFQGLAAGLMVMISGCVSVLPEAAPPKPRLHIAPADDVDMSGDRLNFSVVVDDPRATRVYDSVRIAVSTAPGRIAYLSGAEWADRAPRLFQTALIQTFEDSGRILAVGDRSSVPVSDIVLQTDIRHMEVDVENGDAAVVSVYARLSDGKGTVYAARKFDARVSAASTKPDDVYDAFNSAFDEILSGIVKWTFDAGQSARANS